MEKKTGINHHPKIREPTLVRYAELFGLSEAEFAELAVERFFFESLAGEINVRMGELAEDVSCFTRGAALDLAARLEVFCAESRKLDPKEPQLFAQPVKRGRKWLIRIVERP
jgi:hypothetical protein